MTFLSVSASSVLAGTTGKIAGVVRDTEGNPLAGANLLIEGTRRGAAADAEGSYFILGLDPGRYVITASLVGYGNQSQTNVSVKVDFTTPLDFELVETDVELEEMRVVAKRPPVEKDRTSSKYIMDASSIDRLSTSANTSELMSLQAGVSLDNGEPAIRGSYQGNRGNTETLVYLDGVPMEAGTTRGDVQFVGVNADAVQEITVITGGMEAEYGNATSGTIQIITRDGTQKLHGKGKTRWIPAGKKHWGGNVYDSPIFKGKMKWGDPTWENETYVDFGPDRLEGTGDDVTRLAHERTDYTNIQGYEMSGSLSGPLSKNSSFFLTGQHEGQAAHFPSPTNRGITHQAVSTSPQSQRWIESPGNFKGTYKFSWDARDNVKFKVGGIYARHEAYQVGEGESWVQGVKRTIGRELQGIDVFLPADRPGAGIANVKHDLVYASLTHTLSPRSFYEARLSYYRDATDTTGVPGVTSQFGGGITETLRKDNDGVFTIGPRDVSIWINDHRARANFKFDFSSQINKHHFFKTGIDVTRHSYWWNQINWPQAGRSRYQLAGVPYEMSVPIHPIQSAFYIQDKMEFEGIIVNLGVRYDRHDHNGNHYSPVPNNTWAGAPMTNSWSRQRAHMPRSSVPTKSAWSPRLGVSHPITANAIIRFSYGIFHQMPGFWHLYSYEWRGVAPPQDFNENGQIDDTEWLNRNNQPATTGNPHLDYKRSTNFEVGTDWNFFQDYVLGFTTYQQSADGQVRFGNTRWRDPSRKSQGGRNTPLGYVFSDTRGLELSLRKDFSRNFSFQVSYNHQWQSGGSAGINRVIHFPNSSFVASDQYFISHTKDTNGDGVVNSSDDGSEAAVPLTPTQVSEIGAEADRYIQTIRDGTNPDWNPLTDSDIQEVGNLPGVFFFTRNTTSDRSAGRGGGAETAFGGDRRSTMKIAFSYQSPSTYGDALGGIRLNLINTLKTGRSINVAHPTQGNVERFGPMETKTNLSVDKLIRLGGLQTRISMNVSNLFNQRDPATEYFWRGPWFDRQKQGPQSELWYLYGMEMPKVTDKDYIAFGDTKEYHRWAGRPREISFGLEVGF
jgi:outer membrane receptor for ferrienterochelin and colicin